MAHGYCTLSLAPYLLGNIMEVKEKNMGVNYGLNRLRFTSSMPIASRVRLRAGLAEIEEIKGGGRATFNLQFEVEGKEKLAGVAEAGYRYCAWGKGQREKGKKCGKNSFPMLSALCSMRFCSHRGIDPCFFFGRSSCLLQSISKARQIRERVSAGSMISSTYPRRPEA